MFKKNNIVAPLTSFTQHLSFDGPKLVLLHTVLAVCFALHSLFPFVLTTKADRLPAKQLRETEGIAHRLDFFRVRHIE